MTDSQKQKIISLRETGASYADIAGALGLKVSTVKSCCLRVMGENRQALPKPAKPLCDWCKKPMKESGHPGRRFCSDACRMAWWRQNPLKLGQRSVYHYVCPVCHKKFSAYGNAKRKYCSCKCYGKSKAAAK